MKELLWSPAAEFDALVGDFSSEKLERLLPIRGFTFWDPYRFEGTGSVYFIY